jgi:three-Cys-motif partner protein
MPEKPKDTILPAPMPHTIAKHVMLRKYLREWFPIIGATTANKLIYVDGFAGPGIYQDGSEGSPIIALKQAIESQQSFSADFWFIEKRSDRADVLSRQLSAVQIPNNYKCTVKCGEFAQEMPKILTTYKQRGGFNNAFVFIDPFGYGGIPMQLIADIMKSSRRTEVLLTFMYDEIKRFLTVDESDNARDALFGTPQWRKFKASTPKQRLDGLRKLYQEQLQKVAQINYVRSFAMVKSTGESDYFLFFGTNHPEGLRQMKNAMWKVDPTSGMSFSDNTVPGQTVFFNEPDYEILKNLVLNKFDGCTVKVRDIEKFILLETPFRDDAHLKKPILQLLMQAEEIRIVDDYGDVIAKQRGFPSDTNVKFLLPHEKQPKQPTLF